MKQFNELCKPAQFYTLLSLFSLLAILFQNISEPTQYCLGSYTCNLSFHNVFMFAGKVLYMLVWTIILQSLCKSGYKSLSWFIVLIPFILMFVLLGTFMIIMQ